IFYRNSGGTLSRLGVGADGQTLSVSSGLPAWVGGSGGTGTVGFWNRSGTTLSPTNAHDNISLAPQNTNTGAGTTQSGVMIASTGSTPSSGTNIENLIDLSATSLAGNT